MRISYGWVRGSGYNARTGNNVAICPGGAIRPDSNKKKKKNLTVIYAEEIRERRRITSEEPPGHIKLSCESKKFFFS